MARNRSIVLITTIAVITVIAACEKSKTLAGPSAESVFYSSFEGINDLGQWSGIGLERLRADIPPDGGELSAYISEGIVEPDAYAEVGPFDADLQVRIRCWGKDLFDGGAVTLHPKDDEQTKIEIAVIEKKWTRYDSEQSLLIPKGQKARLVLDTGKAPKAAMLIDNVEVYRVK
jgi:hypothetical protein